MKLLYRILIYLLSSYGAEIGLEEYREVKTTLPAGLSVDCRNSFTQIIYNAYRRYLPRLGIVSAASSLYGGSSRIEGCELCLCH